MPNAGIDDMLAIGFEQWLTRGLKCKHDPVLSEPLPAELAHLLNKPDQPPTNSG